MNPTWIVQPDVFTEDQKEETHLVLKNLGMQTIVVEPYLKEPEVPFSKIILRGSFGLISWFNTEAIRKQGKPVINQDYWTQFSFAELTTYFKSTLNDNIVWLPLLDVPAYLQTHGEMFVRPNSGRKTFSGQVINNSKMCNEIAFLHQRNIETNFLVAVAKPKVIKLEARFIVVDRKIAGQSIYSDSGNISFLGDVPQVLTKFATDCLANSNFPEPHFVLDVAETNDGPKIVEVNAIETASYYNANREFVYQAIEQAFKAGKSTQILQRK